MSINRWGRKSKVCSTRSPKPGARQVTMALMTLMTEGRHSGSSQTIGKLHWPNAGWTSTTFAHHSASRLDVSLVQCQVVNINGPFFCLAYFFNIKQMQFSLFCGSLGMLCDNKIIYDIMMMWSSSLWFGANESSECTVSRDDQRLVIENIRRATLATLKLMIAWATKSLFIYKMTNLNSQWQVYVLS